MMKLETVATRFQELATRVATGGRPDRNALAGELAALDAAPPLEYVDVTAPLAPTAGLCAACTDAHGAEVERRARYVTYGARRDAIRAQLFRLTYGGPDELDDPGRGLADLRRAIRRASDENGARRWGGLEDEADPTTRGKVLTTWVSPHVLGEIAADLSRLGSLAVESGPMCYMGTAELQAAIAQARARLAEIMARPVRVPIDRDVADRAAVPRRDLLDDSDGLIPAVASPSVLEGTIRFKRRG